MKSIVSILIGFALSLNLLSAQTTWNIDPSHSNVEFTVTHLVISEVSGTFTGFEGAMVSQNDDWSDSKISFTADIGSINTDNEKRDGHLKSGDFFDAENHPKLTFESTSFEKVNDKMYKMKGNLTMRGVTKPVELDVKYGGTVVDPWGNTKAGFKVMGAIDRFDYGLKWDAATEAGNLVVGEEVQLLCNIQLNQAKATSGK
jgi:polyisoprenoid-binding protein YceI